MLKRNGKGAIWRYQRVTDAGVSCGGRLDPNRLPLQRIHGAQNDRDDILVADCGIDHDVIQAAGGPVGVEIMSYEGDAIPINRLYEFFRFFFALAYQP